MKHLTNDQHLFLRNKTVSKDLLHGWTLKQTWAVRDELLELGLLFDDSGWCSISDAGLLAVNSPQARRILRARNA